jgi:hypothetical protein
MLTAMTSQRAALRRSDDVVETRRAASFDGPIREVPSDSKRLPPDSVAVALNLWIRNETGVWWRRHDEYESEPLRHKDA